ncbi:MAG: hypothetical protein JWO38_2795 [Gemmataceae bacterium]|nr:hypothetical protein [Gemmataceae bacterium]
MATAPSPNDLTRQQLDELDALLQRMLALPLDPPVTGVGAPGLPEMAATNWRVDPAAVPAPRLFTPPPAEPPRPRAAEPEPLPVPVFRAPPAVPDEPPPRISRATPERTAPLAPAVPPPEPAVPFVEKRTTPAPALERAPAPSPEYRPEAAAPAFGANPAISVPDHSPPDSPVPVALWPLVAFNWTVDTVLGWCGPPGWLLRSGFGKNVLGLAGVGLLLYTAAHVASQQGWVTLPVPLPWPR